MSKKHVELLMGAIDIPETQSKYLCDRIRFITGFFNSSVYDEYLNSNYTVKQGEALVRMIQDWLDANGGYEDDLDSWVGYTFEFTPLYKGGCTRKEWAETILAPLALELPDE